MTAANDRKVDPGFWVGIVMVILFLALVVKCS